MLQCHDMFKWPWVHHISQSFFYYKYTKSFPFFITGREKEATEKNDREAAGEVLDRSISEAIHVEIVATEFKKMLQQQIMDILDRHFKRVVEKYNAKDKKEDPFNRIQCAMTNKCFQKPDLKSKSRCMNDCEMVYCLHHCHKSKNNPNNSDPFRKCYRNCHPTV